MTDEDLLKLANERIKRTEELIAHINATRREINLIARYGRQIERLESVDFGRN